ncbi:hypothetical protein T492DRAFT_1131484 [Pavlovales sp. CCMP2436]|nr:hypothetical protein T492DRAFT_1131484 [Pavlovales sp. CCMP2436]
MSEHCLMLRLLATHPRMTRHGFARVVIHFLKELGRVLGKALDFRLTGQLENEMVFNIQRTLDAVLNRTRTHAHGDRDTSTLFKLPPHFACSACVQEVPGTIPLLPRCPDGTMAVDASAAKRDENVIRIWDKRSKAVEGGGGRGAPQFLVQVIILLRHIEPRHCHTALGCVWGGGSEKIVEREFDQGIGED